MDTDAVDPPLLRPLALELRRRDDLCDDDDGVLCPSGSGRTSVYRSFTIEQLELRRLCDELVLLPFTSKFFFDLSCIVTGRQSCNTSS